MRVFVDTNVLLSAALFPGGGAAQAYDEVLLGGHEFVVSDQVIVELRGVAHRKFPDRAAAVEAFIAALATFAAIVTTPSRPIDSEHPVRDPKDRPILRAASAAGCDVLVTGDRDLIEARIDHPRVLTPAEFRAST